MSWLYHAMEGSETDIPSPSDDIMLLAIENLTFARWQMAFTLGLHIIFACLGVGMPILMLAAEWVGMRPGNEIIRALARRWSKAFATLFAIGAVSGTVLSFEMFTLWPKFMGTFGAAIGLPFTLEGFAFFLEAIFAGIYLYGWDRLPAKAHWWSGMPVAIAGVSSAAFVVTSNAWMNAPAGVVFENGKLVEVNPWAAMTGPTAAVQAVHLILAAYMVSGFLMASVYAWTLLRHPDQQSARFAVRAGLTMAILATFPQMLAGDWAGKVVAKTQPVKLAAMEGQFQTEKGAPLRIGGIPDTTARTTRYSLDIPGGLSWIAYGDTTATVRGLDDFPRDEQPPVVITHFAFQIMVGIGSALALLSLWAIVAWIRTRTFPSSKLFLLAVIASGPAAVIAMEAGWIVTEVGRQPWIAHHMMRTADAVTQAPGIGWIFLATVGIYTALVAGTLVVLRTLGRVPVEETLHGT